MSRSIVVSGNCQITGIAGALRLLFPDDTVVEYPLHVDLGRLEEFDTQLAQADVWVAMTHPDNEVMRSRTGTRAQQVRAPVLNFNGFHPDLVYAIRDDGSIFRGVSDYHSAIGLWAWRQGIDPADAVALFTPDTFRRLGYYGYYRTAADLLQDSFDEADLDFAQFWLRAKRTGVFMHTVNHPCIAPLVLVAKQVARRMGAPIDALADPLDRYLEDSLITSIVWPVYPSVAQYLGVSGSYRFRMERVSYPSLPTFLEAQWKAYGDADPTVVHAVRDEDLYDRVLDPLVATLRAP
jgi:hypothetical protein